MTRIDKRALRRAVEAARRESKGRAQQIAAKLKGEPWEQVAKFCATVAQGRSLRLKPWELTPADVLAGELATSPAHHHARAAYALQQRMRRCGVSKFHPDPVAAIEAAEAARTRAST